ncbi:MAG TPA: C-GCAxxG-C-C family protein [Methanospirillum sp.]|uniref:C-GCAxxG-C-C family protein n=1 Tax=Methanospirillum sp. TaxID=45200 RepID=UPI002B888836|nr:C-GCAxxG-C-C family protein [Methanospirillum sp.]HWQ63506.1 C-GCAxxG-C-C family protein [Methanospirillum sp.]
MNMDHAQEAVDLLAEGYSCSQSVFSVYAKEYGLDPALARKIATGFGGGVGRTGNMCGAVSGAILVLGLASGMNSLQESDWRGKSYSLDKMFIEKFVSRFGSIQCPDLLGYNMAIPEELAESKRVGAAKKVCPELVRGAAEILEEMLKKDE